MGTKEGNSFTHTSHWYLSHNLCLLLALNSLPFKLWSIFLQAQVMNWFCTKTEACRECFMGMVKEGWRAPQALSGDKSGACGKLNETDWKCPPQWADREGGRPQLYYLWARPELQQPNPEEGGWIQGSYIYPSLPLCCGKQSDLGAVPQCIQIISNWVPQCISNNIK